MPRPRKDVALRPAGDMTVPAYLQQNKDKLGLGSITSDDIQIPYLKICQPQSRIKDNYTIKDGEFYNSITGESYGTEIEVYILHHWSGMVWFSEDFKLVGRQYRNISGKLVNFGAEIDLILKDPKRVEEGKNTHNYFVIMSDELEVAVKEGRLPGIPLTWSIMSAGIKYARQLNGKLLSNMTSLRIPVFAQRVAVHTKAEKFPKGLAHMPIFSYGAYAGENEFKMLERLNQACIEIQAKAEEQGDIVDDEKTPF